MLNRNRYVKSERWLMFRQRLGYILLMVFSLIVLGMVILAVGLVIKGVVLKIALMHAHHVPIKK